MVGDLRNGVYQGMKAAALAIPSGDEVAKLRAERDEADRRAGAAERQMRSLQEERWSFNAWRSEQKQKAGYKDSVSFDDVWAETLSKADRATAAEAQRNALQVENARLREALRDIEIDRGRCVCGRDADLPSNCVSCDDNEGRSCRWEPVDPQTRARSALTPHQQVNGGDSHG